MRLEIPVGERSTRARNREVGEASRRSGSGAPWRYHTPIHRDPARTTRGPVRPFYHLSVDIEERMSSAGKIPGGFIKREGRPSDRAILTARLTDRPLRPLFPKGYNHELQMIGTVLGCRPGDAVRHGQHGRGVGGAGAFGHPVRRSDRGRPRWTHPGRRVHPEPDLRPDRRDPTWTSWSPAPKKLSRWSKPGRTRFRRTWS